MGLEGTIFLPLEALDKRKSKLQVLDFPELDLDGTTQGEAAITVGSNTPAVTRLAMLTQDARSVQTYQQRPVTIALAKTNIEYYKLWLDRLTQNPLLGDIVVTDDVGVTHSLSQASLDDITDIVTDGTQVSVTLLLTGNNVVGKNIN